MKPLFITFTGVDDHTDLAHHQALSQKNPIEWGVSFAVSLGIGKAKIARKEWLCS